MLLSFLLVGVPIASATSGRPHKTSFTNLVTFGDSYTDNGRLGYYINHGGSAPPPGVYHSVSNTTASGGLAWGQYVQQYTGANYLDYAVSGAVCSNNIVSRMFDAIKRPFPSVMDDEIPSFKADIAFKELYPDRTADNTVYALWIGTNDLGFNAFLTDSQAPGTTIADYVNCVWSVFDSIYQAGGRRFVLYNLAPLDLLPLYAPAAKGGVVDSQFWANKTLYNGTEYSEKIREYTTLVNTAFEYGVPFNAIIKSRWPGATFSLFNVHQLLTHVYHNPKSYLDGPYNVTGYYHHCPAAGGTCVDQSGIGPSSGFLWYDELHPSAKTDAIIAQNFLDVVTGNSSYGTTYKSF